jgi:PII-like signaling protein
MLEPRYMELPRDVFLFRSFVGEADELEGESEFRKIVLKAREMNLAGATVLRAPLGFGKIKPSTMEAPFSVFPWTVIEPAR